MNSSIPVDSTLTFEAAIAQTQAILDAMAQQQISSASLEQEIAALVASMNGARGFFVTYLTDERNLADTVTPEVIRGLQSSPEIVSDLLVKNLAMSTAMAVYHQRAQDEDNAQGSRQVQRRTTQLLQNLQLPPLNAQLVALVETLKAGTGEYEAFLNRWGYDAEQRQAILKAVEFLQSSGD